MARLNIPRSVLVRVLLRSFSLQASWNFERLQSLGVVYVIAPALHLLYRDEELAMAYQRHLEYFNSHPFLAAPVMGAILSLEEGHSRGEDAYVGVQEFKGMVMAPYAAMGDALFWGGLRPLAATVSLFLAIRGVPWAPLVFLLLFNLPHLWFRCCGLLLGYRTGLRVVELIQRQRLPDLAIRLKEGTVVLLGGLCAYLVYLAVRGEAVASAWGLLALPVVALSSWAARKGVSTMLLVMVTAALLLFLNG